MFQKKQYHTMSLLKTIAIKKRSGTSINIRAKAGKTFSKKWLFLKRSKSCKKFIILPLIFLCINKRSPFNIKRAGQSYYMRVPREIMFPFYGKPIARSSHMFCNRIVLKFHQSVLYIFFIFAKKTVAVRNCNRESCRS